MTSYNGFEKKFWEKILKIFEVKELFLKILM